MNELLFSALTDFILPLGSTIVIILIGALGTYLSSVLKKKAGLETIATATNTVIQAATLTAGELQQTIVSGLKEANADGKLTQQEIALIGTKLIKETNTKLSQPAKDVLLAAQVDITALIKGAAEAWINGLK